MDTPKFIADEMLGRLAKWLRILGYDTAYLSPADDRELVRLARAEGRILLTRDTQLVRRRGFSSLLIEGDRVEEQLRQVIRDLQLDPTASFSRCLVCNVPLCEVERAAVINRLPAYVLRSHQEFAQCPQCGRVYWPGSHWHRMHQMIEMLIAASDRLVKT